jgi:hypothetical protein
MIYDIIRISQATNYGAAPGTFRGQRHPTFPVPTHRIAALAHWRAKPPNGYSGGVPEILWAICGNQARFRSSRRP